MTIEYKVILSVTVEGLVKKVNEDLKFGWKLQGGVSVSETPDDYTFCQAMILEIP